MQPSTSQPPPSKSKTVQDLHRGVNLFGVPNRSPSPLLYYQVASEEASNENIRYHIGERTDLTRSEILDLREFFNTPSLIGGGDMVYFKRLCTRRVKEMINIFVDYLQQNYEETKVLPPFPNIFHKTIVDVSMECLYRYYLITNNSNIYTAIISWNIPTKPLSTTTMDLAEEIMMERMAKVRNSYVSPTFQREDSDSPLAMHEDEIEREKEARAAASKVAAEAAATAKAAVEAGETLTISTPTGCSSSVESTPLSTADATIATSPEIDTPAPPTYAEDVAVPAAPESSPPMFIRHPDGTEEVNPEAYIRRGYGWDGAHRQQWADQLARGHDYDSIPDPEIPNYRARPRSRSNSDSPLAKRARDDSDESESGSRTPDSQRYSPNSPLPYSGTPSPTSQETPVAEEEEEEEEQGQEGTEEENH